MNTTPKAYSYIRFSTPEQAQGRSLERQAQLARDYAKAHSLELDTSLRLQDLGVSALRGKNARTGALGAFLRAIDDGLVLPGSYLLVESLDRVTRQDPWDALPVFQQIINSGVTLVTLFDGREYSREDMRANPMKIMESVLVMTRAHEESATKSRRHAANWKAKRSRADEKPLTAMCKPWLKLAEDRAAFQVIPERAETIRRIFSMALAGQTTYNITHALNTESIPPFAVEGRKRQAQGWGKSYVVRLLADPAVVGTFTPHRVEHEDGLKKRVPLDPVPGYYPAVVDADTFHQVQAMKENRAPLRGRHATAPVSNIFASLVRCPLCGSGMVLGSKNKGTGVRYYTCSAARNGSTCSHRAIRYDRVEAAFLASASKLLAECPTDGPGGQELRQEIEALETGLEEARAALGNVLQAIENGAGVKARTLTERAAELETAIEEMKARHSRLLEQEAGSAGPVLVRKLEGLAQLVESPASELDRAAMNASLRQLLKAVVLDHQNGQAVLHWQHGGESSFLFEWPRPQDTRV